VNLVLMPIEADADPARLAARLAPGFGGDEAPAREILEQTLTLLTEHPRAHPWGCYLAELDGQAIGTCAFKFPPDAEGEVELAYMTFPAFEGRGHATEMAGALVRIARQAGAAMVVALTLPHENASNRALGRNGFTLAGEVDDPEDGLVWRWEKPLAR
jgi:RimJ/RimL family protein N-acetyltransferase